MNIFAKLQSLFLRNPLSHFEPMTQYRIFFYLNDKPYFVCSNKTAVIKDKYAELDVHDYVGPESFIFMMNVISNKIKKINGIVKLSKLGPVGDVVEESTLISTRLEGFDIIPDSKNYYGIVIPARDIPVIRLKLKFTTKKTVIN